jgi:hypothetical protein
MAAMEQRIFGRLNGVETRLSGVEGTLNRLTGRVGVLERRADGMGANLSRQIDGIDKRLDAIEIDNFAEACGSVEAALAS